MGTDLGTYSQNDVDYNCSSVVEDNERRNRYRETVHKYLGPILILLAALLSACTSLFVKLGSSKHTPFEMLFIRAFIQCLVTIPLMCHEKVSLQMIRFKWKALALYGLSLSLGQLANYAAVSLMNIGDVKAIAYSMTIFSAIFGWLLLREKVTCLDMVAVPVVLCGVFFVAQPPFIFGGVDLGAKNRILGSVLALACAVMYGFSTVVARKIGLSSVPPSLITCCCGVFGMIINSLILTISRGWSLPQCGIIRWYLVLVGITESCALMLFNTAIQYVKSARASIICTSDVLFTFMFQVTFLRVIPNLWALTGVCLIGGAIVGILIRRIKKDD